MHAKFKMWNIILLLKLLNIKKTMTRNELEINSYILKSEKSYDTSYYVLSFEKNCN